MGRSQSGNYHWPTLRAETIWCRQSIGGSTAVIQVETERKPIRLPTLVYEDGESFDDLNRFVRVCQLRFFGDL